MVSLDAFCTADVCVLHSLLTLHRFTSLDNFVVVCLQNEGGSVHTDGGSRGLRWPPRVTTLSYCAGEYSSQTPTYSVTLVVILGRKLEYRYWRRFIEFSFSAFRLITSFAIAYDMFYPYFWSKNEGSDFIFINQLNSQKMSSMIILTILNNGVALSFFRALRKPHI